MLIEENKPLARYTTLGIGGPAQWFVEADSEDDVAEAATWADEREIALFVLGGGSNLLVADAGFNGLVLHVALRGISAASAPDESGQRIYRAAAGEDWDGFVARTTADGSAGIECLAGIPGTVGGTPVQNVGAYGQEAGPSIAQVRAFDRLEHCFVDFAGEECDFGYRHSRFNSTDRGRYIVTRVDYRLTHGGAPTVRYADLQKELAKGQADSHAPSLAGVAAAVRRVRMSKGMLLVEGDPDCRSAGSFFKNPIVTEEQVQTIAEAGGALPPQFPGGVGSENPRLIKVPAAWLIEHAGFHKGYRLGRAGISTKHTLALVNLGSSIVDGEELGQENEGDGATAAEMLALAEQINDSVESRFGIRLEMEPATVGF